MKRLRWISLASALCASCVGENERPPGVAGADALAVGDSILAWNRDVAKSIPEVAGAALGLRMVNAAVSGARVLGGEAPIPEQYTSRAWRLLLLDGGGNDIGDACGADIEAVVGEMRGLVDRALAAGAEQVVLLGYYDIPPAAGAFQCPQQFRALESGYEALAAARARALFLDPGRVVRPADRARYDDDLVHPSVAGSETIGRFVAREAAAARAE